MAFNFNYNTDFNTNYLNAYPDSDSDDQFKPRQLVNVPDYLHPNFERGTSQFLFENPAEENLGAMEYDDEPQISYNKCRDETRDLEFDYDFNPEKNEFYSYDPNFEANDMFEYDLDKDMEVEEESDYQSNRSTAFTCDFDDNASMNQSQVFFDADLRSELESNYSTNFESSRTRDYYPKSNAVQMRELVDKILQGKPVNDNDTAGLNEFERSVIMLIAQRKSKSEGAKNARRREEKQKLFFKSALKHIESRFLNSYSRSNNGMKKKEMNADLFYLTYFQDVAQARNIDISAFYPPSQRRRQPNGAKVEQKTFNLKYIELLLSSKRFFEETVQFLQNEFVQNYSKCRYKKIDKIIEHANDLFEKTVRQFGMINGQNQQEFMDTLATRLRDLILNNPKSKLPWSNAELNEAKEFAMQAIRKIYEKTTDFC